MAFYLRRRYETNPDEKLVCGDALVTGSGVAVSGSASIDGSDTVDKAVVLAKLQEIEAAVNVVYTLLGSS